MEERLGTICGRVESGSRIGRTMGFPTANIALGGCDAQNGVYVAEATLDDRTRYRAVADVGCRPSVGSTESRRLEVHLLGFDGDLYGRNIRVELLHRLRPELRFDSMEELREHIEADIEAARQWFAALGK